MRLKPFILFDREGSGFLGLCEIDSYQLFVYRQGVQPSTHTTWQVTHVKLEPSLLWHNGPPVEALRRKTRPWRCWPRGDPEGHAAPEERKETQGRWNPGFIMILDVFLFFCCFVFCFLNHPFFQVLQPSIFRCYVRRVVFDLVLDCFFFNGLYYDGKSSFFHHHVGDLFLNFQVSWQMAKQIQDGWPGLERFQSQTNLKRCNWMHVPYMKTTF